MMPWALAVAAFALYAAKVCPGIAPIGDSMELASVAKQWGVAHPPGFPLYAALAHLAARLPVFDLPLRLNLMSALAHAVAVGLVARIGLDLTRSRFAAAVGAATLALATPFLLGSLYAEVFPLNDAFIAGLLLVALRARRAAREGDDRKAFGALAAFALLAGLASANQQIAVLALPGFVVLLAPALARCFRSPPRALALACAFALPLVLAYGSLLLAAARDPVVRWDEVHDVRSLVWLALRRDYKGPLPVSQPDVVLSPWGRVLHAGELIVRGLGVGGALAAVAGVMVASRRSRTEALALGLLVAASGPLWASFNPIFGKPDPSHEVIAERFTTMCMVPAAVLIALALGALASWRVARAPFHAAASAAVAAAILLPPSVDAWPLTLRDDRWGTAFTHDLLHGVPDGALVMTTGDLYSQAATYACVVGGSCGSRILLAPGQLYLSWYAAQTRRRHPDLVLPPGRLGLRAAAGIARAALRVRRVFVVPWLLTRAAGLAAIPHRPKGLLVELFADEPSLAADEACEPESGDWSWCEGCNLPSGATAPAPGNGEVLRAYESAFAQHGAYAAGVAHDAILARRLSLRIVGFELLDDDGR